MNRIKKSDSPVRLRKKILNFVVKYCENCMFCRAQVIIRRKTSHISWRHSTFLESSRQTRWSSAISWRQNNGKMAERDQSHVIAVLQRLNWCMYFMKIGVFLWNPIIHISDCVDLFQYYTMITIWSGPLTSRYILRKQNPSFSLNEITDDSTTMWRNILCLSLFSIFIGKCRFYIKSNK